MQPTELRQDWLLTDAVTGSDRIVLIEAAMAIVRPVVTEISLDAISDVPLTGALREALEEVRAIGDRNDPRRRGHYTAIGLDPKDDHHFALMTTLAPWVISADGLVTWPGGRSWWRRKPWRHELPVINLADTGSCACFAFTDAELGRFDEHVRRLGLDPGIARVC